MMRIPLPNLHQSRTRIALSGAFASMIFLSLLAYGMRTFVSRLTLADIDGDLETLSIAIGSNYELQGFEELQRDTLRAGLESNLFEFRLENHSAILFRGDTPIAVSGDLFKTKLTPTVAETFLRRSEVPFTGREPFSGQRRVCRFLVTHLGGKARGSTLVVFRYIEPKLRTLQHLDTALIAFVLLGFLGTAMILALAVHRALRPVGQITRVAAAVQASDLSGRVTVGPGGGEEFLGLAGVINSLFERLERAFMAQRRLVADAAHELKTPVAVILGEAQDALREESTGTDITRSLEMIQETSRGLAHEVDALLLLARGDIASSLRREPLDLSEIAETVVTQLRPFAAGKNIRLTFDQREAAPVFGDRQSLLRLMSNLGANAILYTEPETEVTISVRSKGTESIVEVRDHGPGVPPEERARIFERFVRLERTRSVNPAGSGLGLAIVAQAAGNHGAVVEIEDAVGGGSLFRVRFPRAAPQEAESRQQPVPAPPPVSGAAEA